VSSNEKIAVVLLQFGGPDSLDAVEPFLFNLFSDPDIIKLPFGQRFQKFLAKIISKRRAPSVQTKYADIGGKSPIVVKTLEQQKALENELRRRLPGRDISVKLAMRYWKPFTEQAVQEIKEEGIEQVVLLPLYAQFSVSNAGSSFNEWDRVTARLNVTVAERRVSNYHLNAKYLSAINQRIDEALTRMKHPDAAYFLFSAHGTPVDMMEAGDPYAFQIRETVEAVMALRGHDHSYTLAFQSKVGPKQWLTPSTPETLSAVSAVGIKDILVIPIAFVSDHIETLHELEIELREEAEHLGVRDFVVMRGLNDSPLFIETLADIAIQEIDRL
jgi:protoporphyrin/coproporphyrin ferrochelatase